MCTHRHNDTYFHLHACTPKRPTSASTHTLVPIQVVNLTSQVYYLWITKRKKNDSDKDDIDMWSDNEQGANLHQVTLASMQREIDSLKEQLTKANKVTLKPSTDHTEVHAKTNETLDSSYKVDPLPYGMSHIIIFTILYRWGPVLASCTCMSSTSKSLCI